MKAVSVARLAEPDIPAAAAMLARAFHEGPLQRYYLPDPDRRAVALRVLFTHFLEHGLGAGEVHVIAELTGVAIWLPQPLPAAKADAGSGRLAQFLGEEGARRRTAFAAHLAPLHRFEMPGPHWYLSVIGVDPEDQGRGLGGALLKPMLERAAGEGLPVYLETAQPRNVPFYLRHGFRLAVEGTEPSSGLSFWTFRREPKF